MAVIQVAVEYRKQCLTNHRDISRGNPQTRQFFGVSTALQTTIKKDHEPLDKIRGPVRALGSI